MLIPAVAAFLLLVLPVAGGGDLRRLLRLPLRRTGLLPLALLLQVAVLAPNPWTGGAAPRAWHAAGHVASYLALAAFLIANRHLPGLRPICAGVISNGLTIAVNGGTLPAAPDAVRRAGLPAEHGFANSGAVGDPQLAWLGDVFAVPAGWPLANTFSVGDVLIWLGIAVLAVRVTRPTPQIGPVERHLVLASFGFGHRRVACHRPPPLCGERQSASPVVDGVGHPGEDTDGVAAEQ